MLKCLFLPRPPLRAVSATLGTMRQPYETALATNNFVECLRILNCNFKKHTAVATVHRYSLAVRQLCQMVGETCPTECVLGLTHVADYHLHIGEYEEAHCMYDAAQAFCVHVADDQPCMKRILRGHLPTCMSIYMSRPSPRMRARVASMFERLMQCELSLRERATVHRFCAEMHLLCSATAEAKKERETMYACIGRSFDPVCSICLEDMQLDAPDTVVLPCFHTVHLQCCRVQRCPLCRCPVSRLKFNE